VSIAIGGTTSGATAVGFGTGLGCFAVPFFFGFAFLGGFFRSRGDAGRLVSSGKIETNFDVFFSLSALALEKTNTGVGN